MGLSFMWVCSMLGWVPFRYGFTPPEEVDNPRPIYIEVYKKELAGVLHYLDDYQKAVCGKAWSITSVMDGMGSKMAVDKLTGLEPMDQKWVDGYLPCPDCLTKLKK